MDKNEKAGMFSGLPANFWLVFSFLLILFSIGFIWYEIVDVRSHISVDDHTDFPILIVAIVTLVAASITVWVSWMIKEEARGIGESIKEATVKSINFQTSFPIVRRLFDAGINHAVKEHEKVVKLHAEKQLFLPFEEIMDCIKVRKHPDKVVNSLLSLLVNFTHDWVQFKYFSDIFSKIIKLNFVGNKEMGFVLSPEDLKLIAEWLNDVNEKRKQEGELEKFFGQEGAARKHFNIMHMLCLLFSSESNEIIEFADIFCTVRDRLS